MESVFAKYQVKAWPYEFHGTLHVRCLVGGIPANPKVAEGWLKKKLGVDNDATLRKMVAETMVERGVDADAAVDEINKQLNVNGFKRDPERGGELYIEGRQLKSMFKEATCVAMATGKVQQFKWGNTNKQIKAFTAEHICVPDDRLYLGVTEPTGVQQRFVSTRNGTGIQYEEYVEDAKVDFRITTDYKFSEEHWAMVWLTGQEQGIGATRSQGYGRFTLTRWESVGK